MVSKQEPHTARAGGSFLLSLGALQEPRDRTTWCCGSGQQKRTGHRLRGLATGSVASGEEAMAPRRVGL